MDTSCPSPYHYCQNLSVSRLADFRRLQKQLIITPLVTYNDGFKSNFLKTEKKEKENEGKW